MWRCPYCFTEMLRTSRPGHLKNGKGNEELRDICADFVKAGKTLRLSGEGKAPARRLTSLTEADWGVRSLGGPGHGVALPAAGRGWALSRAQ